MLTKEKLAALGILLVAALGCGSVPDGDPPKAGQPPLMPSASGNRLFLESAGGARKDEVHIVRTNGATGSEPRMIELWLKTTNVVSIVDSQAGPALDAAGKQLMVQAKGDGLYRVLAFSSSNTNTIGPGVLAALNLERASDGPMRVEILTDRPIFAPQEVQEGLIVGDPITL